MDYWDVSLKNNVKNVQKGITLQNRKVGKLFSLFIKQAKLWVSITRLYVSGGIEHNFLVLFSKKDQKP